MKHTYSGTFINRNSQEQHVPQIIVELSIVSKTSHKTKISQSVKIQTELLKKALLYNAYANYNLSNSASFIKQCILNINFIGIQHNIQKVKKKKATISPGCKIWLLKSVCHHGRNWTFFLLQHSGTKLIIDGLQFTNELQKKTLGFLGRNTFSAQKLNWKCYWLAFWWDIQNNFP